ncbi:hypothetical protein I0C86_36180 [Plantactinospora sp. S1510]|uniref:Uncharacterized protein n=1 Tax=Plantactinospora alkalitolerans TaxID=2789879 RepID=A0ABS0H791_9ACTN|nr:hypothetical protein [Plantactinospora alkalitolerans]MBF9134330.1 hypothetical protein [Plantactinospora alkalitolerans]
MVHDQRIGRLLTELTEDLTPRPDPYGRVLARHRRGRRRAVTGTFCAVVLLAATGVAIAGVRPGGGSDTPPATAQEPWENMLAWGDRLARSEPRGTVGGDAGYVAALADTLMAEQRAGRFDRLTEPVREVRVLFVDDVGPHRVALAAFVRAEPVPDTDWPNDLTWMVADRGAGAQDLGRTAAERGAGDGLAPYESLTIGSLDRPDELAYVGVAPQGCVLAAAPMTSLDTWTPEPTGSYLVRPPGVMRPEWFRVSCDGVTRKQFPSPGSAAPEGVTDEQFATAMSRVRGKMDEAKARVELNSAIGSWGYTVTALPTVLWIGRTTGVGGGEGHTMVLTAPAVGGGWLGQVAVVRDVPSSDGATINLVHFHTRADPGGRGRVLAVHLDQEPAAGGSTRLLVVAPSGATEVRAIRDGSEVSRGQVRDGAAQLTVPGAEALVLEAVDGTGAVLGTGGVADPSSPTGEIDNWDED